MPVQKIEPDQKKEAAESFGKFANGLPKNNKLDTVSESPHGKTSDSKTGKKVKASKEQQRPQESPPPLSGLKDLTHPPGHKDLTATANLIVELLSDPKSSANLEQCTNDLVYLSYQIRLEIAKAYEPVLNKAFKEKFGDMPTKTTTREQKIEIVEWLRSHLQPLGLTLAVPARVAEKTSKNAQNNEANRKLVGLPCSAYGVGTGNVLGGKFDYEVIFANASGNSKRIRISDNCLPEVFQILPYPYHLRNKPGRKTKSAA